MQETVADPLSLAFAALAHPTRRAILARLASGDAGVTELMEPFDLSQPAISKHLKVAPIDSSTWRREDDFRFEGVSIVVSSVTVHAAGPSLTHSHPPPSER